MRASSPFRISSAFASVVTRILVWAGCGFLSVSIAQEETNAKPNIIVVMADDLGYGDVALLNQASRIPTPHLDRLGREGMRFTDAHSPSAVCTPTRYGLITGRYCWRSRLKRGVLNGFSGPLISTERKTLASVLKDAGYATGIVGKWHLGLGFHRSASGDGRIDYSRPVSQTPNANGFDFSHIIPASLDFPPYVYIRNDKVTALPTETQPKQSFPGFLRQGMRGPDLIMESCLDDLTTEAVKFVREQSRRSDQPFFLYFPLTAPHKPVLPHPRFRGRSGLGPYGDFVMQVDATVGEILAVVDESGIADNTLVIFTSDNGSFMYRYDGEKSEAPDHVDDGTVQAYRADRHRSNHIYRGTKADIWEAGHRVPFLVRWPGKVRPASVSSRTICHTDIFATCAEIVGASVDARTAQDSFSFLGELKQVPGKPPTSERPPVIHHSGGGMFAIRSGKWKLVLGNGSGGREKPRGRPFEKPWQLFDLESDPAESKNVIDAHPDVATELEAAFEKIREGN